jgi:ATP/ADP translocase
MHFPRLEYLDAFALKNIHLNFYMNKASRGLRINPMNLGVWICSAEQSKNFFHVSHINIFCNVSLIQGGGLFISMNEAELKINKKNPPYLLLFLIYICVALLIFQVLIWNLPHKVVLHKDSQPNVNQVIS